MNNSSIPMLMRCFDRQFAGLSIEEQAECSEDMGELFSGSFRSLPDNLYLGMCPIWSVDTYNDILHLMSIKYEHFVKRDENGFAI